MCNVNKKHLMDEHNVENNVHIINKIRSDKKQRSWLSLEH